MFSEILKIIPKIEGSDLNKMEGSLTSRFGKIAKRFGKGVLGALTGGGIAALGLSLIDKLLNPLKETQEAIDKTLQHSNDLVVNAKQFGTTAGKLAKLQAIGKASGLEPGELNILLEKFQNAVAQNKADPTKNVSVRQFSNDKDTAESFFSFIQSLKGLDKPKQLLVQNDVFGEKQVLRMAEFLNADFTKLDKFFAGISTDKLTAANEKISGVADLSQTLTAVTELKDQLAKAKVINNGVAVAKNNSDQLALNKENQQIANFQNLSTISDASTKILTFMEKGLFILGDLVAKVTVIVEKMAKLSGARFLRGIFGGKED